MNRFFHALSSKQQAEIAKAITACGGHSNNERYFATRAIIWEIAMGQSPRSGSEPDNDSFVEWHGGGEGSGPSGTSHTATGTRPVRSNPPAAAPTDKPARSTRPVTPPVREDKKSENGSTRSTRQDEPSQ